MPASEREIRIGRVLIAVLSAVLLVLAIVSLTTSARSEPGAIEVSAFVLAAGAVYGLATSVVLLARRRRVGASTNATPESDKAAE